jgi:hypothetical protein
LAKAVSRQALQDTSTDAMAHLWKTLHRREAVTTYFRLTTTDSMLPHEGQVKPWPVRNLLAEANKYLTPTFIEVIALP